MVGAIAQAAAVFVPTVSLAETLTIDGIQIDLGGASSTGMPMYGDDVLSGIDKIVFDLDNITVSNATGSIYTQDESGKNFGLFEIDEHSNWDADGVELVFKQDGQEFGGNQVTIDVGGQAKFTYSMVGDVGFGMYGVRYQLQTINLQSTAGNGLYLEVSEEEGDDLKAQLIGDGNITFGYVTDNPAGGFLTLAGSEDNTYTGWTYVGYSSDGGMSPAATTIYFGKSNAFGDTANLDVHTNSSVYIGGANGDQAYEQKVHGLRGLGLIDLGQRAHLTLNQVSAGTGYVSTDDETIRIDNKLTGLADAKFDIILGGEVNEHEVWFSQKGDYTGTISLTNGKIYAYDENRTLNVDGKDYVPNEILTTSTLELKDNASLWVDSTGKVHHLIVNGSNSEIVFDRLGNVKDDNQGALTISDNLTLNNNATIHLESMDYNLGDLAKSASLIEADDGLLNHLIHVLGQVDLNNYSLSLDEASKESIDSDIKQGDDGNTKVATGTWQLESALRYDETNKTFDLAYVLTKVAIEGGQTLLIEGEANATAKQDFTALITDAETGSGNITFAAGKGATGNGTIIEVGNSATSELNSYTGKTKVDASTKVVLVEDSALGKTSELLASGDVTLNENIKQTVGGIDSNGTGTIALGNGSVLTIDSETAQTINNVLSGTGSLVVDLNGSTKELIFNNQNQSNNFTGNLTLSNGRFSLDSGHNADFAENTGIVLGSGSIFDLGSGSAQIKDLTVNENASLESSALVIGSGEAPHQITGQLTMNGSTTITLDQISVADDLMLVNYDGTAQNQNFITTGGVTGDGGFSLRGSESYNDLGNLVLDYQQTQGGVANKVAETVWSVGESLTKDGNNFQVSALLKEIHLIGNTVLEGIGQGNTLSALVSTANGSGSDQGLQFSSGNGDATSFTVTSSNTYTGKTTVDDNVTVTLASNSAFGQNSLLDVAGTVVLNNGIGQAVRGLAGSGTITLNDGSVLSLTQVATANIDNILTGAGTFRVNLGNINNALVFTNKSASAFNGTVELTDGYVSLENGSATQTVLTSSTLSLGDNGLLRVEGSGSDQRTLGNLLLGLGSSVSFAAIDMGDASSGNAQLLVTGQLNVTDSSSVNVGGINLSGTSNILSADDVTKGLKQALVTANGGIKGDENLELAVGQIDPSEIRNNNDDPIAAYGVWIGNGANGNALSVEGNTVYASLRLNEIQLALANGEGLKLDLSGLSDQVLSAKLTNYQSTAGNITFTGNGTVTVSGAGNDYTGRTYVSNGAKVTLGANEALGDTSLLSVSGQNSQVNLNNQTQTLTQLVLDVGDALTGDGALTLNGSNLVSTIAGANAGLTADVTLANSHTLHVDNVASVGNSGTLTVNEGTVFEIEDAASGSLSKVLSGNGTVNVIDSIFMIAGNNSDFTGAWNLSQGDSTTGTQISVKDGADAVDAALGTAASVELGKGSTLNLIFADGEGLQSIDEILTGSGELSVTGDLNQTFGFESAWDQASSFDGTLSLSGIGLDVGGATDSTGDKNARNLIGADLSLANGSIVNVNGLVTTFDTVSVTNGGFTFTGMGFNAPNSTLDGVSQLTIKDLNLTGTTVIRVNVPAENGDLLGDIAQNALLSYGQTPFQTLIATGGMISDSEFAHLTLDNTNNVQKVSQGIFDGQTLVATGYYNFGLALSSDQTDVGILYKLTQVDIANDQILTLSEDGTLDAQLTSSEGTGHLTIAQGGDVTLGAEGSSSQNSYTGNTTINSGASLTAWEHALGNTTNLIVNGSYTNAGANAVDLLDVATGGSLTLDAALTLEHATAESESSIAGATIGSGAINVGQGTLSITENVNTTYGGQILLGQENSIAALILNGVGALGGGSVQFGNAASTLTINDDASATFKNELIGQGIIAVDLDSTNQNPRDFTFGSKEEQLSAGSKLVLTDTIFDLTASDTTFNDDVAQKLILQLNSGSTLANDGLANKSIYGLVLNGGLLDLGALNTDAGQITLTSGSLTINENTQVKLDSSAQVSDSGERELDANAQDLLSGGVFDLSIFEKVTDITGDASDLGTADSNGNQLIGGLDVASGFSGTQEKLYQDVNGDSVTDHVANMVRDDGHFYYNDANDSVFLQYTFKQIDLLWTDDNQGLTINAQGKDNAQLAATLTGEGNIRLAGPMLVNGVGSSYTGKTYVLDGAAITLGTDSAFGSSQLVTVGNGATVTLANGVEQSIGGLTGAGSVSLGVGSTLSINNSLGVNGGSNALSIGGVISTSEAANFNVDGGFGEGGKSTVHFENANNLAGATFTLTNSIFNIADENSNNYMTASSAADWVIGGGTEASVTALSSGSYNFNELSFTDSGSLVVNNVTLSDQSTDAVIHTNTLDLTKTGTLAVSAKIDESFDLLVNDGDTYSATLIAFGALNGRQDNLGQSAELAASEITNTDGETVAWVGWDGDIVWGNNTVGMQYQVANVQLADADGEGLVLSAQEGKDSTLSATVTDYGNVHGNITFAGGDITVSGTNDYHGKTLVKGGSVTLAKDAGFGNTALLSISNGAKVNFGTFNQTVGALNAAGDGALSGSGRLTLGTSADGASSISGSNAFAGTVVLANGHTLTIDSASGVGSGATLEFGDANGELVLSGANGGTFATTLNGKGTVTLSSSTNIAITGDNQSFGGQWVLSGDSSAVISDSDTLSVDQILGNGATVQLTGHNDTLTLSQTGNAWSINETLTGAGTLTVNGTSVGQMFGFSTQWANPGQFTGTLSIGNGLTMTVGGMDNWGANNASNLAFAKFNLGGNSTLIVATQDTAVETFNAFKVDGGTIKFNGQFGLGANTNELAQLHVGSLSGAGNISLDLPDASGTVAQTITQNGLLDINGSSLFQSLITVDRGTLSSDGWTLNDGSEAVSGEGLRQRVVDGSGVDVAHAVYNYGLTVGSVDNGVNNALGIGYVLSMIDILNGQTLSLSEDGTLSVKITDTDGAGSLLITSEILLSGTNDYSGTTTVSGENAKLTVGASGLGNTSDLILTNDADFVNNGLNKAGQIHATNSDITLNSELQLTSGGQVTGGTFNGAGALTVQGGTLTVNGLVSGGYTGSIALGGVLNLHGGATGLGTGLVTFDDNTSQVNVDHNDSMTLTNTYTGAGQIVVDLGSSDNVFAFAEGQSKGAFTGSLSLQNATYQLFADADRLSSATLHSGTGSLIVVNTADNVSDRALDTLELAGGTIDFGTLLGGTTSGQIVTDTVNMTADTILKVALGGLTDENGSSVFGSDAGTSVILIEGVNATDRNLSHLKLDGSTELTQVVSQENRGEVAEFGYTGGNVFGSSEGIGAQWDLSTITLTNETNNGFLISAAGQTGNAGTIDARILGTGNVEFGGGAVTLSNESNNYTGTTRVTSGELILGANGALGQTEDLIVNGHVTFGSTTQEIGALHINENGSFSMNGGSLTLTSGESVIASANAGATNGTLSLTGENTALKLQDSNAAGDLTLNAGADTTLTFTGFGGADTYGEVNNLLQGDGTYQIGDGTDATYVQLTNTGNTLTQLEVQDAGHLLVEGMEADNALDSAALTVLEGGEATLNGGRGWILGNALNVASGATLAISAGDSVNEFRFTGTNQSIDGTLSLTNALLNIGGVNAGILDTATLVAGTGSAVHVNTGTSSQVLDGLTLSGGSIYFDGTLGINVDTNQLGQLSVGSLALTQGGTLHVTASDMEDSRGDLENTGIWDAQDGLYQRLIAITGGQTINKDDLNKITLFVDGENSVVSNITQGVDGTVAHGTYGFKEAVADDGKSLGVSYTLTEIDLLETNKTLKLVGVGDGSSLTARLTGVGNLEISNAVTLVDRDADAQANDYTGETRVLAGASLTAGARTLGTVGGYTSLLLVMDGASFNNSGENVVGALGSAGTMTLNDALTVVGTANSSISGTLSGAGDLTLQSGELSIASGTSSKDFSGDVSLGATNSGSTLSVDASAGLGTGTIHFANTASVLNLSNLSGDNTLSNLLTGTGTINVSGSTDSSFAFHADQTANDLNGSRVHLTGIDYNLGSDILSSASLSLTSGTLFVNKGVSTIADRSVAGLALDGTTVDFGVMGSGAGAIDLQGKDLVVGSGNATLKLNAQLSDLDGDDGSAAMTGADSITLIKNIADNDDENITINVEGGENNRYKQAIYQNGSDSPVAYILGALGGWEYTGSEGDYDLIANLTNDTLAIVSEYVVSTDGEIGLDITDYGSDAGNAGNLTITGEGVEVTLSGDQNTYSGKTSVASGATLTLGVNRALGQTSELSVDEYSTVEFGTTDQTVGILNSDGTLVSDAKPRGTLTVTHGGQVSGSNTGFHMDIVLDGTDDLTIKDVSALGDGQITISQVGTSLRLSGILSDSGTAATYANRVTGAGGLSIQNGSTIKLTGENDFTGDLVLDATSTVVADGDIYSHIGKGSLKLNSDVNSDARAEFTLSDSSSGDWTWSKHVTGDGVLTLDRTSNAANGGELLLGAGSISDFSGQLWLKNWGITLNANGDANGMIAALKGSGAALTLGEGSDAEITGHVDLSNKVVTLADGGRLVFTGVAAPGGDNSDASRLTSGELHLNEGFVLDLSVENASVDGGSLLTQDDAAGTTVTVAHANSILGDLSKGFVTVNGDELSNDQTIRFDIHQAGENDPVAEGIYGVTLRTTGDAGQGQDLSIDYSLAGVNLLKTLDFAGVSDDRDDTANIFKGYIIGSGNLRITDNTVYLTNSSNAYSGSTTVVDGATLYADAQALGQTSELNTDGSTYILGDNEVQGLNVGEDGLLVIGDDTFADPENFVTLTLRSDSQADHVISGDLRGNGVLEVFGDGQVDDGIPPDLTIEGSQGGFAGKLNLADGAWVHIKATDGTLFGNSAAQNDVTVSGKALLTIESELDRDGSFYGVFRNGADGLGGTVEITLGDAENKFYFAETQAEAGFNGRFVMNKGTIDFNELLTSGSSDNDPLAQATLELGQDGIALLSESEVASVVDSQLGGLSMNGGSIVFGSINYVAGDSEAHASHINLNDGKLELHSNKGSSITLDQGETNVISDDGQELLAAASGNASIVLIHNIGELYLDGQQQNLDKMSLGSEYLNLINDAQAKQIVAQNISHPDDPVNVAEVTRTFDDHLTFEKSTLGNESGYMLSLGYTVDQVGLLYQTDDIADSADALKDSLWQGLTIKVIDGVEYGALITDASNGDQGNIVFVGDQNNGALTLSGKPNTYHGKTWLKEGANIVFDTDNAFGETEALRVDDGSSVNFGGFDQALGMIFASGEGALLSTEDSVLTIGGGLITGANDELRAATSVTGELTINNVHSLGTGAVTLGSNGSNLIFSGAQGTFANAFNGISDASMSFANSADVTLGRTIDNYAGSFSVDDTSALALTLTTQADDVATAFTNEVTVAKGGELSLSGTAGGEVYFGNSSSRIEGGLEVRNALFDLSRSDNLSVLHEAVLSGGTGSVITVSTAIGPAKLSGLTLGNGSTLRFETGGTPGQAGQDSSLGHIDLGEGAFNIVNVEGTVTIGVDVSNVNADHDVSNLPLTAQDVLDASGNGQLVANLIKGKVENTEAAFNVAVTGGDYDGQQLKVGIYNNAQDQDIVANGIYDYKVTLGSDGLNLSYGLAGVELIGGKELSLQGYDEPLISDNELAIVISGEGDLRVASGELTLTNKENSYSGATTVASGATLIAGLSGHTLGNTSLLDIEASNARAVIHGDETVGQLQVAAGSTLTLESTGDNKALTFTIDNTATHANSVIDGSLIGGEDTVLAVKGDGTGDDPDLLVNTNNEAFHGDVKLTDAHVRLETLFGFGGSETETETGTVYLNEKSTLEISSSKANDSITIDGQKNDLHRLTNLIEGDGTVRVALDDANDYFDFAGSQYDYVSGDNQAFTGTFELQRGIFKFNEENADVLQSVYVVVDGDATLDVSMTGNERDRNLRGLTLAGGTLVFGSLSMDSENAATMGAHIDLMGGNLVLDDSSRQVEIAFEANATNTISSDGSEIVDAADSDGSQIVLIHNIGDLTLAEDGDLNDYLKHELADNSSQQDIRQSISSEGTDIQTVARVNRDFGDFGYKDMSANGIGNALYVGYQINSIELMYTGSTDPNYGSDGAWKGLTVSSSGSANELSAQLTGQGNLVVARGDSDPLRIGNVDGEENSYTGRTWVMSDASVEFADDNAFGQTSQLRIDRGASVNLGDFDQTVGVLLAYGDDALVGSANSVLTVTNSATIDGSNDQFLGRFVFDSEQSQTGTVSDVDGLGLGSVAIGGNYTLEVIDQTKKNPGDDSIVLDNDLLDANGQGGVLQIGQVGNQPSVSVPIELAGNNSGFSGTIRVQDGWKLTASVGDGETITDRLGSGVLDLLNGQASIDFVGDVLWDHHVTGSGELVISAKDHSIKLGDSAFGDDFSGTVTVGGGSMDLASNADKLGNGDLAASGSDSSIHVSGGQSVSFGNDLTIKDGASLVFEDTVDLSEQTDPELIVGGSLVLDGAIVDVELDGELDISYEPPKEGLDMSAITMADESELSYVLAKGGLVDISDSDLILNGSTEYNPMSVDITNGTETIAKGKYDFGLGVSEDRTELGLSYKLVEVEINPGQILALTGAVQGETALADWENASDFSAKITGTGGIALLDGDLTLSGHDNSYEGETIVGGSSGSAVLTVESSLGNTSHVIVNQTGKLINASDETKAGYLTVAGGELELREGSLLTVLGNEDSVVSGSITGSGALKVNAGDFEVVTDGNYSYSGRITVSQDASYTLTSADGQRVNVANSFAGDADAAGTVAFNGNGSTYELLGSAVDFANGAFLLGDGVTIETSDINALGGEGAALRLTTSGEDKATVRFDYDKTEGTQYLSIAQQMTQGITFAKSGTGVVELTDSSHGAGAVDVEEGGVIFGEAGSDTRYSTAMTVRSNAWAAGFGAVDSLTVAGNGSFYVGGMTGYNSLVESLASSESADGKTVTFTVGAEGHVGTAVTNSGTIYVGNKTASGEMPTDSDFIGNELVINGDYVTSVDQNGGILDMNAIIAGNDGSKADHVTITGGIKGQGYIDVNYDETASTGGKLDYLGLVSVGEGEDPDNLSLKLKDSIKIDDLYYALMYSTEQNEYYLMSSVTDPGDDPWKTEDVENVDGATRSALAFMQSQVFDLSLHDHVGETLYVDPLTGEEHSTSFWMIQRGDWTKFTNESGQMDSDGHVYTTHLGTDLIAKRTDNATFRVGVLGSFADGQVDVTSNLNGKKAQGEFRGYSAGLYFTAQSDAESGPFADLQLRWNRFNNTVGLDKYHLDGLSVTAEAGWDQLLSKGVTETGRSVEWRVEPHIRAYWTDFGNPEEWTSPVGETMKSEFDNGMLFRLGARTKVASKKGSGPAVQAYAEANWVYNYGDYKTTVSTQYGDVTSEQSATNFAELRMGFEVQFTPKVNVWVEGHHNTGSNDYESSGAMVGFKYQW